MIEGFAFSLKRFMGIAAIKLGMARKIDFPIQEQSLERKIGSLLFKQLFKRM